MLLTQPAVETKAICRRNDHGFPDRDSSEIETGNMRLGEIFDWMEDWYNMPGKASHLKSTDFELDMQRLYPKGDPLLIGQGVVHLDEQIPLECGAELRETKFMLSRFRDGFGVMSRTQIEAGGRQST